MIIGKISMHYPKHIAIIPDGNRTRAEQRGFEQIAGHLEGEKNAFRLLKHIFGTTKIDVATFWGLSTENVKRRSKEELKYLYGIYKHVLDQLDDFLKTMKISFLWIGSTVGLPKDVVELLRSRAALHNYNSGKSMVLAMNYGGRDEIIRGVKQIVDKGISSDDITEEILSQHLDCGSLPPIDLVIRTKGEVAKRLSGFMLRRIGYAELFFTNILFPDFNESELDKALAWYDAIKSERNFGK